MKRLGYHTAKARLDLSKKDPRFAAVYSSKDKERDQNAVASYLLYSAKLKEKSTPISSFANKEEKTIEIIDLTVEDDETEDEDGILWPRSWCKKLEQQTHNTNT